MDNYNEYKQKYSLWLKEKQKEEELLRQLHFDEALIQELNEYDKRIFNQDRRYYSWNYELFDYTSNNIPYIYHKDILSFEDLLDSIEDETVFKALITLNEFEKDLIILRLCGYTFKEIAGIFNMKLPTLYSRFKKIQKVMKSSKK